MDEWAARAMSKRIAKLQATLAELAYAVEAGAPVQVELAAARQALQSEREKHPRWAGSWPDGVDTKKCQGAAWCCAAPESKGLCRMHSAKEQILKGERIVESPNDWLPGKRVQRKWTVEGVFTLFSSGGHYRGDGESYSWLATALNKGWIEAREVWFSPNLVAYEGSKHDLLIETATQWAKHLGCAIPAREVQRASGRVDVYAPGLEWVFEVGETAPEKASQALEAGEAAFVVMPYRALSKTHKRYAMLLVAGVDAPPCAACRKPLALTYSKKGPIHSRCYMLAHAEEAAAAMSD